MSKLYVAIERFKDLQDDGFEYKAGMIYPREGVEVSEARINELATSKNLMGKILIAELTGLTETIKTAEVEDVESEIADETTEVEDTKKTRKSRSKKTE